MSLKSIESASFHDRERLLAVHSQDNLGWPTLGTIFSIANLHADQGDVGEARKLFLECEQIYTGQTPARPWTLLGVHRMQGRSVRMIMRRRGRRKNSA
jgi:hypothetical protein